MRLWLVPLIVMVASACSGSDQQYASAAALRADAEALVAKAPPSKGPPESGTQREFIVDCLGSAVAEVREAAIDLLSTALINGRPVRASKFTQYLGEANPPAVRAIALAYAMWGHAGPGEIMLQTQDRFVANSELWRRVLNALIPEQGIEDKTWLAIVIGMDLGGASGYPLRLVDPANAASFGKRLVALLDMKSSPIDPDIISDIAHLGPDLGPHIAAAWFHDEKDASARAFFMDYVGRFDLTDAQVRAALKPLLDEAASDPDERTRTNAKRVLLQRSDW